MADLLDATWFRAGGFGAAMLAMVVSWRYEFVLLRQTGSSGRQYLWPLCWLLIGGIYASMAAGIAFDFSTTLGGLGREYARSEEWYESRRPLQTAVVTIVGVVWLAIIVIGIWRVPERRRRYLPSALLCTSLVCFVIIRLVSLHLIDTIFSRVSIAGVPVGTIIELFGITLAVILVAEATRQPIPGVRPIPLDQRA